MIDWVCPQDRGELERAADAFRCRVCGARYPELAGSPLFATDPGAEARLQRPLPLLDELWRAVERDGPEAAALGFCEARPCSRHLHAADWKFFLPAPAGRPVLELGAGFGDDTVTLAASRRALALVPHATNARIVARRLAEAGPCDAALAVADDPCHLPLPDGRLGALTLEDAAAGSFRIDGESLRPALGEWRRVLAPGGVLFLGLASGVRRLPLGARLLDRLSRGRPESLNRTVKRAAAERGSALRIGRVLRLLRETGFGRPALFAPLPGERDPQVVIPLEDRGVVRYFLNNLVRKNSLLVRGAVGAGDLLARRGLFRHLVPYTYLIVPRDGADG